jgi:hypothetical protein
MKRERKVFVSKAFSRTEKVQVWNTQCLLVLNDVSKAVWTHKIT